MEKLARQGPNPVLPLSNEDVLTATLPASGGIINPNTLHGHRPCERCQSDTIGDVEPVSGESYVEHGVGDSVPRSFSGPAAGRNSG